MELPSAPPQPTPPYDLAALEWLLCTPGLLPAGYVVEPMGGGEYAVTPPGGTTKLRVTVRPEAYEFHPESRELWGPGSPLFPLLPEVPPETEVEPLDLPQLLSGAATAEARELPPATPPWAGSSPSLRSSGANRATAAWLKPENETGVASSTRRD